MNTDSLYRTLIRAGRTDPPSEKVPYAFEKRIMAAVRGISKPDPMKGWVLGLWRAAVSFAGVAAIICVLAVRLPVAEDDSSVTTAVPAAVQEPEEVSGVIAEDFDLAESW